jgi:hypothetical protein
VQGARQEAAAGVDRLLDETGIVGQLRHPTRVRAWGSRRPQGACGAAPLRGVGTFLA